MPSISSQREFIVVEPDDRLNSLLTVDDLLPNPPCLPIQNFVHIDLWERVRFEDCVNEVAARSVRPKPRSSLVVRIDEQLAAFKAPKRIFFVDDLPRNAMGKVQKNVLRETFKDAFA